MCIFSQQNEATKIDFRNYDQIKPNRMIPYRLPENIKTTIHDFMDAIGMQCGSIDMILTPNNEYVFLEVNPVGQFQWVEKCCNFDLSKAIARVLIDNH